MKFRDYCITEINRLCDKFENNLHTGSDYVHLSKTCLACTTSYNARRGTEVASLKISKWKSVEDGHWKKVDSSFLKDPIEKILVKRLDLCYVLGKRKPGRKVKLVPILFTPEMVRGIKTLIQFRSFAGISRQN